MVKVMVKATKSQLYEINKFGGLLYSIVPVANNKYYIAYLTSAKRVYVMLNVFLLQDDDDQDNNNSNSEVIEWKLCEVMEMSMVLRTVMVS